MNLKLSDNVQKAIDAMVTDRERGHEFVPINNVIDALNMVHREALALERANDMLRDNINNPVNKEEMAGYAYNLGKATGDAMLERDAAIKEIDHLRDLLNKYENAVFASRPQPDDELDF